MRGKLDGSVNALRGRRVGKRAHVRRVAGLRGFVGERGWEAWLRWFSGGVVTATVGRRAIWSLGVQWVLWLRCFGALPGAGAGCFPGLEVDVARHSVSEC